MRHSTEHRAPRPVRPAAAALSRMLSRSWSLPPQRNFSPATDKEAAHA